MTTYRIAELNVNMTNEGQTLKRQSEKYRTDKTDIADIAIHISDQDALEKQKETPQLSLDECIYIWTGSQFYHGLLDHNGFILHASAVAMDDKAYLFSANSGIGKSTHTELWQKHFGEDRAFIVNDDKPAIRYLDGRFYVYGTPWSGKSSKNLDIKVPLQSIVFIERSEVNHIHKIDSGEAIKLIMQQTLRPNQIARMDKLLFLMEELLKTIPIYKMGCNISEDAVELAYSMIQ